MSDLICGKTAVGGNYNSTRDNPNSVEIITDICATAKGYESLYLTQSKMRKGA